MKCVFTYICTWIILFLSFSSSHLLFHSCRKALIFSSLFAFFNFSTTHSWSCVGFSSVAAIVAINIKVVIILPKGNCTTMNSGSFLKATVFKVHRSFYFPRCFCIKVAKWRHFSPRWCCKFSVIVRKNIEKFGVCGGFEDRTLPFATNMMYDFFSTFRTSNINARTTTTAKMTNL